MKLYHSLNIILFFLLQDPGSAAGPQGSSTPKSRDHGAGGLAEAAVPRVLDYQEYADIREADDSGDDGGGRPSYSLRLEHRSAAVSDQEEKSKKEEKDTARRTVGQQVMDCLNFTDSEDESDQEMKDVSQKEEPMDES